MTRPRPITVLIVEDHPDSRDILVDALDHAGMRPIPCASMAEALQRIADQLPHALITDLALGREEGAALAAHLRTRPETRDLPIIAITGRVEPTLDVVKHFDAYLRKPVDVNTLPGLIRTLVEVASTTRDGRRVRE